MEPSIKHELAAAVRDYRMSERGAHMLKNSNPMIICGVTAAGKNTVAGKLVDTGEFSFIISHTTRPPRVNHGNPEQDGQEYWFISEQEMLDMIKRQEFLEVEDVHFGTYYGKSITELDKAISHGKRPIFDIDVKGAMQFTRAVPELKPIFLLPPSYDIWMQRLAVRGAMSDVERSKRLRSAKAEINTALKYNDFILVINHEAAQTLQDLLTGTFKSPGHQREARSLAQDYLQYLKDL